MNERMDDGLLEAYLARLGLSARDVVGAPPSADLLRLLHTRHLERIAYENLDITRAQLGDAVPPPLDPHASARRIASGLGGYCYHLNGALHLLLTTLGFEVRRHVGGVWQERRTPAPGATPEEEQGNHLALTVLLDGDVWYADVGLGDALYEPVRLPADRSGPVSVAAGPFSYRVEPGGVVPGGWRFLHDPRQGSYTGMDFGLEPVPMERFAQRHHELSTSPQSPFVRVSALLRRDADGVDALRGVVLSRHDAAGRRERELTSPAEWFEAATEVFGLQLGHVDAGGRERLWAHLSAAHAGWTRRPDPEA